MILRVIGAMSPWKKLPDPEPGYSIILGVPWSLRHLLNVNLAFIAKTDSPSLKRIHVVFDRRKRPGAEKIIAEAKREFPDLPLEFAFYGPIRGAIIEKVDVSTFYNSMNCVTALSQIRTSHAVLHDFDLYPVVPEYFEAVYQKQVENKWKFCGLEQTFFDGLTQEDLILGTWCLGMDVGWLRNERRPHEVFHRMGHVNGKPVNLDPFSWLQTQTDARGLVGVIDETAACHVRNLCSTHLRFISGRPAKVVWRLHYLWYLEHLAGDSTRMDEATAAMNNASDGWLRLKGYEADFSETDPTCAGILRDELVKMEQAMHGGIRAEVTLFIDAFESFLTKHGLQSDAA